MPDRPLNHVFIVNPCAGGRDRSDDIRRQVEALGIEAQVYVTRAPGDATLHARALLDAAAPSDTFRFYACGGDGTLGEVATACAGRPQAELACLPCGSGNDYVRNWPGRDFFDLRALVDGVAVEVDTIRVGDRTCVNVLNFGFEAEVCRTMERVRRWPILGGRMAYVTGIIHSLLRRRHNPCQVSVDGEPLADGDLLLASAAVGQYVGGGFRCAPRAVVDDGLLEAQAIDSLSIPAFLRLIGLYRQGRHLDSASAATVIHYRRGSRVLLQSDRPFSIVLDGELLSGRRFEAVCQPRSLRFVLPAPSPHTPSA